MLNSKNMKVITLTTQYANNMGAQLQCYALSRYLKENEHVDCEVLNYYPVGANRSWSYFPRPRTFRDFLKNIYCLLNFCLLFSKIKKQRLMRKFITKYIPLTHQKYKRRDLRKKPPLADAFIVGSDQVWNFKYRCDETYFLDFVDKDKSKIIAYAPSIADPWNEKQALHIKPYLERFDCLSIREEGNLDQVRQLSPKNNPVVVVDPVFLLKREQWDTISNKRFCIDKPYILCYFLSVTPLAIQTVAKIRELTGMKVVHYNLCALDKFNSELDIHYGDPTDFVGLISNASYVCTNSFHCSAFAIIYRKNFMFVPKHMANERISNLIENFGLSNVFSTVDRLNALTKDDLKVDFSKVDSIGKDYIDFSKNYLHNSLLLNHE